MFLTRVFGRALFSAAAKSEASAAAAAAYSTAARNPLEDFFEVERKPDDDTPVVYGRIISFCYICLHSFFFLVSFLLPLKTWSC